MKTHKTIAPFLSALVFLSMCVNPARAESGSWLKQLFEKDKTKYSVEEIVEETTDINEKVKDISEDIILGSIEKYNRMISEIREEVNSRTWFVLEKDDEDKFEIIFDGIAEIKDFYEDLLEKNKDGRLEKKLLDYITDVTDISKVLKQKEAEDRRQKQRLEREYNTIIAGSEYEGLRRTALQQRMIFCEQRIKMLQNFSQNYIRMAPILENASNSIDRFFYVIEQSEKVYSDAYRTLKLRKDIWLYPGFPISKKLLKSVWY